MKKLTTLLSGAVLAGGLTLSVTTPAYAPHFRTLDDLTLSFQLPSEAKARSDHEEEIDILTWSWGETSSARSVPGERLMRPKMGAGTLTLTLKSNWATKELRLMQRSKTVIPSMTFKQPGDDGSTALIITMKKILVSSVTATSGDADDRPTEEVAFYYNKISFSDSQQKPARMKNKTRADEEDKK